MFVSAYFQEAAKLFESYDLQMPLHRFLKQYFSQHPKFGSRDRRCIAELLHGIYRMGAANQHLPLNDRMVLGAFLAGRLPLPFFEKAASHLSEAWHWGYPEKLAFLEARYPITFTVPFLFSNGIDKDQYFRYLFTQPRVFIRIRKNKTRVLEAIKKANIPYEIIEADCLSFSADTALEKILSPADYVVQDISSQHTSEFMKPKPGESWWDCCAASGGKSILLLDKEQKIKLTVSDSRESILQNLRLRFAQGKLPLPQMHTLDLLKDTTSIFSQPFDGILCDAPCSGSGTWAHSPEQFYFFNQEKLNHFQQTQTQIVKEVSQHLRNGAKLLYMTCSVFAQENEEVCRYIQENTSLYIEQQLLLNHFRQGGDAMYITVFSKG